MSKRAHCDLSVEELVNYYRSVPIEQSTTQIVGDSSIKNQSKPEIIVQPGQNPNYNKEFHCGYCQAKRFRKECIFKY